MQCYEKNEDWASCNTTCHAGVANTFDVDGKPWSCNELGSRTVPIHGPSLFCFSVVQPNSNELRLVRGQLAMRASIFACHSYAVLCSASVLLGRDEGGDVWTWAVPVAQASTGQYASGATTVSYLNALTFITAWDALLKDGSALKKDWVVKADPDAVFFPERLRELVEPLTGTRAYFGNCGKFAGFGMPSEGWLWGALEVFSKEAIEAYAWGKNRCMGMQWQGWGEDTYMQKCMRMLGVHGHGMFHLVGDFGCTGANCSDTTFVAFHPYKSLESYFRCWSTARTAKVIAEYRAQGWT